jgi:hypothetical protein
MGPRFWLQAQLVQPALPRRRRALPPFRLVDILDLEPDCLDDQIPFGIEQPHITDKTLYAV